MMFLFVLFLLFATYIFGYVAGVVSASKSGTSTRHTGINPFMPPAPPRKARKP